MGFYGNTETVQVKAKGSAPAAFTSATFKASLATIDKSGPAAKAAAKDRVAAIWEVINANAEKAGIDTGRLRTTFAVDVHNVYDRNTNEQKFAGYKATYSINFTARNVSEALNLHDALTSIEGIVSPTPVFNIDESPEVHAQAFTAAFQAAQVKFGKQCQAVGHSLEDFVLQTWSIEEEQQHGKMLSVANGPVAKAVGAEPGKAILEMTVTFVYGHKQD